MVTVHAPDPDTYRGADPPFLSIPLFLIGLGFWVATRWDGSLAHGVSPRSTSSLTTCSVLASLRSGPVNRRGHVTAAAIMHLSAYRSASGLLLLQTPFGPSCSSSRCSLPPSSCRPGTSSWQQCLFFVSRPEHTRPRRFEPGSSGVLGLFALAIVAYLWRVASSGRSSLRKTERDLNNIVARRRARGSQSGRCCPPGLPNSVSTPFRRIAGRRVPL